MLGYVVAGWNTLDAVNMVIITVFGVGYGEVQPVESAPLRYFTIAVIVAGYGAAIYAVGGFVQMITEGEIHRALGLRRMTTEIDRLNDHAIVCGYGRIGRILCSELRESRSNVVVVDQNEVKVRAAREGGFVTLTASRLAPKLRILARAEDPSNEAKLRRSGATEVVLRAASGARHLAHLVTQPDVAAMLDKIQHSGTLHEELGRIGLQLEEFVVSNESPLVGRTVGDLEIDGNHGFLIVALRHEDGRVVVKPPDWSPIAEGHAVIVVGHENDLPEPETRYELRRERSYRGVRYESCGRRCVGARGLHVPRAWSPRRGHSRDPGGAAVGPGGSAPDRLSVRHTSCTGGREDGRMGSASEGNHSRRYGGLKRWESRSRDCAARTAAD